MKKIFLPLCLFLMTMHVSRAQIAYYDAFKIDDLNVLVEDEVTGDLVVQCDSAELRALGKLLYPYFSDDIQAKLDNATDGETIYKILEQALSENPFFTMAAMQQDSRDKLGNKPLAKGGLKGLANMGLSKLGGLDVTTIANGIATFMIERSKEELTVAFFNRFKKFVENNPEFRVLFPKTTDNLENLLSYRYPEMLPALRTGFFEDLRAIPYHFDDVLELPRYQELLKNFPEIKVAIRTIRLIHEIEAGETHVADALTKFANFREWDESLDRTSFQNFGNSIKLADIFSTSLRDANSFTKKPGEIKEDLANAWVSFKELQLLVENVVAFKVYLGLIYISSETKGIEWYVNAQTVTFTSLMAKQKDNIFLFENKVVEFIELASEVDNTLDSLSQKKNDGVAITNDDYYNYINTSLDVLEYGYSIVNIFVDNEKFVLNDYTKIARKSNDLYRHIYKEEYTQAVSSVMDIYKTIKAMLEDDKAVVFGEAKVDMGVALKVKSFDKLEAADINSIQTTLAPTKPGLVSKIKALFNSKETLDKYNDFIAGATKYGLFMSNLANAKSEEEVQAVLQAAALPVGSSSIKKNSCFNISVQSYLGAYWTNSSSSDFKAEKAWNDKFGVIAPIGISFNFGFKKAGSVSLFTSLLDLGAIVDYKLTYDTIQANNVQVSKDYKIELGQIFSPGAYLVYGFPWNLPLSFGIGGQYGPGLNSIDSTGNTVIDNPYWRWNAFIAVDIPLFNIYNKERKR